MTYPLPARLFLSVLLTLTVAVATLLMLLSLPRPAAAAGTLAAPQLEAESRAPTSVIVRGQVTADTTVTDLALHIRMGGGHSTMLARPAFTPSPDVTFEHEIITSGTRYVPPGTEFRIMLEARDAAGNTLTTSPITLDYLDNRFDWRTVTARDGLITAYYYGDAQERAQRALRGAEAALDNMEERAGVKVDQPFRLIVFSTAEGWRDALPPARSRAFEDHVGYAGLAYGDYDLVLMQAVRAGSGNYVQSTAAHEVTHVIVHRAGGSHVASWLNEGLAVYGESGTGRPMSEALRRAIAANRLLLVRGIQTMPSQPELVGLFYAQAHALVKFLLEEHPPEQMAALLSELKAHASLDEALRRAYGFDQDGLDAAWRSHVAAPPREYTTAAPTPVAPLVDPYTLGDVRTGGEETVAAVTDAGPAAALPLRLGLGLIGIGLAAALALGLSRALKTYHRMG